MGNYEGSTRIEKKFVGLFWAASNYLHILKNGKTDKDITMIKDKEKEAYGLIKLYIDEGVPWELLTKNALLLCLVCDAIINCSNAIIEVDERENHIKITPHRSPGLSIKRSLPPPHLRATACRAGYRYKDPIEWEMLKRQWETEERARRLRPLNRF